MRIESNPSITAGGETGEAGQPGSKAASKISGGRAGTQAGFPTDQARVGELAAQVNRGSEIRTERVAAIQSAIHKGTYQVSPEQTADAMLSELLGQRDSAA